MDYNKIIIFMLFLVIMYFLSKNLYENFEIKRQIFDYQFPMNRAIFKDTCQLQGTIEQIDNPNIDSCYITNYIPYLFNVGDYKSDVMPL